MHCSDTFPTMPIKHLRRGCFVTHSKMSTCYPLIINARRGCIENFHHILYADSEETLRQIVADFADKYDLDRYFVYGYGSHHLWLKQREITNPDITFEYRILIVEY